VDDGQPTTLTNLEGVGGGRKRKKTSLYSCPLGKRHPYE